MDEETRNAQQTEQQTTETVGDAQNPRGTELTFDQMLDSNPAYRSISIHALRMEGDLYAIMYKLCELYFNPRPPHGGRRMEA